MSENRSEAGDRSDQRWLAALRRRSGPAVLVVLAAVAPVVGRLGLITDYWALLAGAAVCFAAAGLSLNLLMGYAGQISLGQFTLLGVGAFTSGIITNGDRLGLPFVLGLPAAAAAGGVVALLIGLPALRLRGLYLAVATIAFSYAMEQSIFRASWVARGSAGLELPRPLAGAFAFTRNADYLGLLFLLLAVVWWLDVNVSRTKLGRAFHAIRADESVAASFGVDVPRYKLLAFVVSGVMAGIAGAMYGHLYQFVNSESFGYQRSLLVVIIVVIGGLGSRGGVATSAAFYALFPILTIKWFGEGFRGVDLILGAGLLMYTMARHPGGLAEAVREQAERRRKRAEDAVLAASDAEVETPVVPQMPRPTGIPARAEEAAGVPLLAAHEISVRFGGLQAVDGASLEVPRGRIVGLIGPNGAGKTTLFNALTGIIRPDSGRVELRGEDITSRPAHVRAQLGVGRTFQLIGLAKDLSVTENLLLAQHTVAGYGVAPALLHVGPAARGERVLRARAAEAVELLGFGRYADTPLKRLSHGQQRIVELACALVTAPDLVLLDEPSAGMAPGAAENLAVRLRDVRDELGRTILLIEHNIPLVLDVCDDVYVLAEGRVLAHGPAREVVSRPEVIDTYLGVATV